MSFTKKKPDLELVFDTKFIVFQYFCIFYPYFLQCYVSKLVSNPFFSFLSFLNQFYCKVMEKKFWVIDAKIVLIQTRWFW